MVRLLKAATVLGVALVLGAFASPAPAAKGVKKTGEQHVRGVVVSVHHGKKGAQGHMTIRVTHHKQKKGQPAVAANTHHTFMIDKHTHVHTTAAGRAGMAALHAGAHVTVATHNHHADVVTVHHPKKLAKG